MQNEEEIVKIVEPNLLKCRAGDWEHAKRVVKWMKVLGVDREDLPLLVIASYIHDIGWRDLIPNQVITLDKLLEFEERANANSEPYSKEILNQLGCTEEEIEKVLRLIRAADRHQSNGDDEEMIVDADALSKLDIDHIKQKYQKSEWMRMYNEFSESCRIRIRTKKARELFPKLLEQLRTDIEASLR